MSREQILAFLIEHKEAFLQKYHIEKIGLFGSYARYENRMDSDIDIVYRLSDGYAMSFDNYLAFENELKNAFSTNIDIINEKKLNPLVKMKSAKDLIYV